MWKRLDEAIGDSEKMAGISLEAVGLWTYILAQSDSKGRYHASETVILKRCMTHRKEPVEVVQRLLAELCEKGAFHRYEANGRAYIVAHDVEKFNPPGALRYQDPKYPDPPADICKCLGGADVPHAPKKESRPRSPEEAVPPELKGLHLYEGDFRLCGRWTKLLASWKVAFPGVDVVGEVRKAHAWEVANPTKVKKDRPRFLQTWLSRQQDSPARSGPRQSFVGVPPPARAVCPKCGSASKRDGLFMLGGFNGKPCLDCNTPQKLKEWEDHQAFLRRSAL